ncbi:hypothetical protein AAVH_04946 [Aphelenchoides avenae]|nr:hypothetical protein AAVH_04946 [Aphelenchus avenae]
MRLCQAISVLLILSVVACIVSSPHFFANGAFSGTWAHGEVTFLSASAAFLSALPIAIVAVPTTATSTAKFAHRSNAPPHPEIKCAVTLSDEDIEISDDVRSRRCKNTNDTDCYTTCFGCGFYMCDDGKGHFEKECTSRVCLPWKQDDDRNCGIDQSWAKLYFPLYHPLLYCCWGGDFCNGVSPKRAVELGKNSTTGVIVSYNPALFTTAAPSTTSTSTTTTTTSSTTTTTTSPTTTTTTPTTTTTTPTTTTTTPTTTTTAPTTSTPTTTSTSEVPTTTTTSTTTTTTPTTTTTTTTPTTTTTSEVPTTTTTSATTSTTSEATKAEAAKLRAGDIKGAGSRECGWLVPFIISAVVAFLVTSLFFAIIVIGEMGRQRNRRRRLENTRSASVEQSKRKSRKHHDEPTEQTTTEDVSQTTLAPAYFQPPQGLCEPQTASSAITDKPPIAGHRNDEYFGNLRTKEAPADTDTVKAPSAGYTPAKDYFAH